jgi:hypothetical protein
VFQEWKEQILTSNLGPPGDSLTAAPQRQQQQLGNGGGGAADQQTALGLAQQLNLLTQFMVQQESNRNKARESERQQKKAPYSKFEVAKLVGWAGVDRYDQLPEIWNEFLESDDPDDHREMLKSRMETWFRQKNKTMPKGIYFTKEQIKQITSVKFTPGGAIGVLESANQGVSIALCLPKTISSIQSIQRYESLYDEAKQNLTFKEVQRKEKGMPIEPPATLEELQKAVEVTLALVASLCGENDLFDKLFNLFVVLNGEYAEAVKGTILPETIRHYFWAIFEEMRDFFNTTMKPQDFVPGKRRFYPMSCMDQVANKIRYAEEINRRTYPAEWRMIDEREAAARRNERQFKFNQNQFQGGGYITGVGGGGFGGGERRGGAGNQQGVTGGSAAAAKHVHQKIAQVMKPIWSALGPMVNLNAILTAANLRRTNLPVWNPAVNKDNENKLCYNHICGVCRFGDNCSFIHVKDGEINDGFASEFARKIKPGVDYILKQQNGGLKGGANIKMEKVPSEPDAKRARFG